MTLLASTPIEATTSERRTIQFTVQGLPAPQGSKSYKGHSKAGRAILVESSQKVAPWRQDVVSAAQAMIDATPGFKPIQGPVHLIVEFYLPRPKGAPKTRRVVPATTPDLSKLIRSTEDAMKTAAVWRDDAQVVDTTTRKRYATFGDEAIGHPWELPGIGAVITVVELDPEDTWADTPLDLAAAGRFHLPQLPGPLTGVLRTSSVVAAEWGDFLVIGSALTDARARAALAKVAKISDSRAAARAEGGAAADPMAVVIEGGGGRLMSTPGKPLSELQRDVIDIVNAAAEEGTGIVVILADEVL